jgi:hypothetical protein
MEKLVYVLWRPDGVDPDDFRAALTGPVAAALRAAGGRELVVEAADSEVAYARGSVIANLHDPVSALVSFWLDTHLDRAAAENALADLAARHAGFLVLESVPIPDRRPRPPSAERLAGTYSVGFLERPARLSHGEWLELWQGRHTRVAIETQSTFLYVQNEVVRALTPDAPPWAALVEEGFPAGAFRDPKVFYAAGDSDEVLDRNRRRMVESCARFIEFDRLESHVFSRYEP